MFRKIVSLIVLVSILLAGCSQATTAPAPTEAQPAATEATVAEPTEASEEPTAEPTVEPTAEPAATETPACTEPVMLDFYMVGNGDTPAREAVEAAMNEYIQPLICANVVFHIVGWGDWFPKAITGIQAGEKMDIFFTADWWQYNELVAQGLLLPLNDPNGPDGNLLEQYAQGTLASLNPAFISGTQINGVNYAVPTNKELAVPQGMLWNVTAADEIGFTEADAANLKSPRDLEPWLEKAKAARPEEYPFNLNYNPLMDPRVPGFASGIPQNIITMNIDPDDSGVFDETIYNFVESQWFSDYVTMMREWNQKGWVNPEAALQGYEADPIMNAGKFFIMSMGLKGGNIKSQELVNTSGNPDLKLAEIQTAKKVVVTLHTGGSMLAIPALSEYPVQAMQFINLLHTDPKVVNMALFGVEGTHWELEADGRVNLIDNAWYAAHPGAWVWGDTQIQFVTNKEDPDKSTQLIEFSNDAYAHPSLGFRFVKAPVEAEITAVQAVVDAYWTPLIYGYIDPATELPKFIEELKAAGVDVVIAEVQAQYDAWKAATK
jgi:putative aldouronate transport system substrate-binding protein